MKKSEMDQSPSDEEIAKELSRALSSMVDASDYPPLNDSEESPKGKKKGKTKQAPSYCRVGPHHLESPPISLLIGIKGLIWHRVGGGFLAIYRQDLTPEQILAQFLAEPIGGLREMSVKEIEEADRMWLP